MLIGDPRRARRTKHLFGAALRQAGIAAAGCLHALDHHVDRLAEDHQSAQYLAAGLAFLGCDVEPTDTNMVFFDPSPAGLSGAELCEGLLASGIRMGKVAGRVRAVTHLDVTRADIEVTLDAVGQLAPH